MSEKLAQCQRILKLLQSYEGRFVPLPEILDLRIASYTKRLSELRASGCIIELHEERLGHERHTSYRLVQEPHEAGKESGNDGAKVLENGDSSGGQRVLGLEG